MSRLGDLIVDNELSAQQLMPFTTNDEVKSLRTELIELRAQAERLDRLLGAVPGERCQEETWSWKHFNTEQVDGYWIRCTLTGPHDEHADTANTGLTWRDSEPDAAEASPAGS